VLEIIGAPSPQVPWSGISGTSINGNDIRSEIYGS